VNIERIRGRGGSATTWLFALAATVAGLALLALGQGLTFFADEWAVIEGRSFDLDSFIRPFNEHWLGLTILVYRLMFAVFGLGSYVPYLVLLIALHLVLASEVFVLVRRAAGPPAGLAAGVVILFFGSGFEDLFWAMQIGFIGAAVLGFGAMLALDGEPSRGRALAATALLVAAVSTSGLGLVMVAAVGLELLADRLRRRLIAVAIAPSVIYLAWYLALGRAGVATARDPFTLEALGQVPAFVIQGAGAAAGGISGLGPLVGIGLIAAIVGAVGWRWVHGDGVPARTVGCLGGVVALYVLTGLVRAQLVADAALYTRYTYLAGPLLLVALGALVGPDLARLRVAPRTRIAVVAGGASLLVLALSWNLQLLVAGRTLFLERAERTRALVTVALAPLPLDVESDRTLILVPSPASLERLVATHGTPLSDPFVIGGVPPVSDVALADARRRAEERKGSMGALPQ
jgi:hypothetical protein